MLLAPITLIAACGGGGNGLENVDTIDNGLISSYVSAGSTTVNAGGATLLTALASMRGSTPETMVWTIIPMGYVNESDQVPQISDPKCGSASFIPPSPTVSWSSGSGLCQVMLIVPPKARSGQWRLTNTAMSKTAGATTNSVVVSVNAAKPSGFAVLQSITSKTGYVDKQVSITLPFVVNPGSIVTDVSYKWTLNDSNPGSVQFTRTTGSTAVISTSTPGQYSFNVEVTANVNGFTEVITGSAIAVILPANFIDILNIGTVEAYTAGDIVKLDGVITNRDSKLQYEESWSQLPDATGLLETVVLSAGNTAHASFIAPKKPGNYAFEYKVVKYQADDTKAVSTSQKTIVIDQLVTAFTVDAGQIQSVGVGTPVSLNAAIAIVGKEARGTTYSYKWEQESGPSVMLLNPETKTAAFVPSAAGQYIFVMSVTAVNGDVSTTVKARTMVVAK